MYYASKQNQEKSKEPTDLKNQPNIYSFANVSFQPVPPQLQSLALQQIKKTTNQQPKQQQVKSTVSTNQKNQSDIYSFTNVYQSKPIPPKKEIRPPTRMQTGLDGMNFEEYNSSNQNFEDIKKELAQIVQK